MGTIVSTVGLRFVLRKDLINKTTFHATVSLECWYLSKQYESAHARTPDGLGGVFACCAVCDVGRNHAHWSSVTESPARITIPSVESQSSQSSGQEPKLPECLSKMAALESADIWLKAPEKEWCYCTEQTMQREAAEKTSSSTPTELWLWGTNGL